MYASVVTSPFRQAYTSLEKGDKLMSTPLLQFPEYWFDAHSRPQYLKRKYLSYLRIHYRDPSTRGPGTRAECVAAVVRPSRRIVRYANSVSVQGAPLMDVLEDKEGIVWIPLADRDDYAWQLVAAWDKSVLHYRVTRGLDPGPLRDREAMTEEERRALRPVE